jgi:hypothetical protein
LGVVCRIATVLKRLFNPKALIALEDHYNSKKKVVRKESQTDDSLVAVVNIPADAIVIDLDRAFHNEKLFAGSQGERKRTDFLADYKNALSVSNIPVYQKVKQRLIKSSRCMIQLPIG